MENNEVVLVIDFGSPYNQLLTRNIRAQGVYSELRPHTITVDEVKAMQPKAIILSGGPYYVEDDNRYRIDEAIYSLDIPMLGICYGMQLLTEHFGGKVENKNERAYEELGITTSTVANLFADLQQEQAVIASVGDIITEVPTSFQVDATFKTGEVAAISDPDRNLFGIRFYPELEGTEYGTDILKNFLFSISECAGDWSIERFIQSEIKQIQEEVGDRKVLCGLSGE